MIYMYAVFGYLFVLTVVALFQMKKVKTQADFAVAGRNLSPWMLVLTMLATWIGTGSILGNAGEAYAVGISAAILVCGGTIGLIFLTSIAPKVRSYEKFSVPEIIESRYGHFARILSVIALVVAYLVIVSYQFNAGGGVLQVVMGKKEPVPISANGQFSEYKIKKGHICFSPPKDFQGQVKLTFDGLKNDKWDPAAKDYTIKFVPAGNVIEENKAIRTNKSVNTVAAAINTITIINFEDFQDYSAYRASESPQAGSIVLWEPKISINTATLIAAAFIVAFTMIAGLISVAYVDIGNGSIIILAMLIAFPYLLIKAGGIAGMTDRFHALGRSGHMDFFENLTLFRFINLCLPGFLLILGDANMYQRFFASKSAKGARQATFVLIFIVTIVELLIIGSGWIAGSLIPDANAGRYVMIVAAKELMPVWLGCIMMMTIVAIIMSTADSFLLVPSNSLIRDIYMVYINPKASEKHVVLLSRIFVLCMGIIAFMISLTFERSPGFLKRALYAYTIYGSAITPSLVAALFWKRATTKGAIASILAGTFVTLTWKQIPVIAGFVSKNLYPEASVWKSLSRTLTNSGLIEYYKQLDEVLPAITISVLALVLVSLLTRNQAKTEPADARK